MWYPWSKPHTNSNTFQCCTCIPKISVLSPFHLTPSLLQCHKFEKFVFELAVAIISRGSGDTLLTLNCIKHTDRRGGAKFRNHLLSLIKTSYEFRKTSVLYIHTQDLRVISTSSFLSLATSVSPTRNLHFQK